MYDGGDDAFDMSEITKGTILTKKVLFSAQCSWTQWSRVLVSL